MSGRRSRTGLPIGLSSALRASAVSVARGGNQVALKLALTAFAPLGTAFGRMAISSAVVFGWAWLRGVPLQATPRERPKLALLGALFTVQIGMLHWGADLTSPAYGVVLINTNPIFVSLISHFVVPGDRLTVPRVLGLGVAFAGVAWVSLGHAPSTLAPNPVLGNMVIVASGFLLAVRTVYIQRLVQKMDPAKAIFWQMLFSLPLFAAGAGLLGGGAGRAEVSWMPLAAIGFQGVVVGGIALIIWVHLLKKHTPGALSVYHFVTPIAGVLLSAWVFGEQLSGRLIAGMAAVLVGVTLVTRSQPETPQFS